ncbi:ABC transporter permease [Lachnoclostridium phytofermentans]|uniref:Binding-protein-dependent transport systems inner membrane component n=1 Tax=Lachnoclostridium phytofermentans (strain ATCC 700394 / DSM 18823 / ISDg) TaxID=357809 RepID=A9KKI9_LACP7|nr:ABC transporter permease subunit [Lachnoclostridium phytofermentans]ABX41160.1 binding-protein-dependent transport systems inner membrane component [Lachnoclostridium phytofermentans ISDg]
MTDLEKQLSRKEIKGNLKKYRMLYVMVIPGILYFIIFKYVPLFGNVIAFQEYNIFKGISGSKWVGFKNFIMLFQHGDFIPILKNTIIINFYDLLFGFTAPLILALMINDISSSWFRKGVQQIVYLPHFLSWTILGGIVITQLLSPSQGLINIILQKMGMEPVYFMTEVKLARGIVVLSGIWKEIGWGTVVYLAAITSISPSLYEAASLDGAGKFRQMLNITLPSIIPVIITLFLLRIGHFLDFGFERIWVFQNASNTSVLETFDTYIYKAGLLQGRYSYTTAVGLFKSVVGFLLLYGGNIFSKKTTGESLF